MSEDDICNNGNDTVSQISIFDSASGVNQPNTRLANVQSQMTDIVPGRRKPATRIAESSLAMLELNHDQSADTLPPTALNHTQRNFASNSIELRPGQRQDHQDQKEGDVIEDALAVLMDSNTLKTPQKAKNQLIQFQVIAQHKKKQRQPQETVSSEAVDKKSFSIQSTYQQNPTQQDKIDLPETAPKLKKNSALSEIFGRLMAAKIQKRLQDQRQSVQELQIKSIINNDQDAFAEQKSTLSKYDLQFENKIQRWNLKIQLPQDQKQNDQKKDTLHFYEDEKQMCEFENTVNIHLNRRARAIKNWQSLNFKVAFFRAMRCKMNDDDVKQASIGEKIINYLDTQTISPSNFYKFIFDCFTSILYLFSLFSIPFLYAFKMRTVGPVATIDSFIDYVQIIDIMLTMVTRVNLKGKINVATNGGIRFNPDQIRRIVQFMFYKQVRQQNQLGDSNQLLSFDSAWTLYQKFHQAEIPHIKITHRQIYADFKAQSTIKGRLTSKQIQEVIVDNIRRRDLLSSEKFPAGQLLFKSQRNSQLIQKEFLKLLKGYAKGLLIFDLLACIPIIIIRDVFEYHNKFSSEMSSLQTFIVVSVMSLRLLRFAQLPRIAEVGMSIRHYFCDKYTSHRLMIQNFCDTFATLAALILFIHLNACIQIQLCFKLNGWIIPLETSPHELLDNFRTFPTRIVAIIYYDAIYFVTSTITTVGYGDDSALSGSATQSFHFWEMIFVMFLEFTGILAFTFTSNRFFNQAKNIKFSEVVKEAESESMLWIFTIDRILVKKHLPIDIYDLVSDHVSQSLSLSTLMHYKNSQFFKNMPPRLQEKLVFQTLGNLYQTFEFMFNDHRQKFKSPSNLIMKILTNLECNIYVFGSVVLERSSSLDSLLMVGKGTVNLIGYDSIHGQEVSMIVTKLIQGSWFGDYEILNDKKSEYSLVSATRSYKNKTSHDNYSQVYKLRAEKFQKFMRAYPQLRIQFMLRSKIRKAYWARCKMESLEANLLNDKLSVFETFGDTDTNDNLYELIIKYYRLMKARVNDPKYDPQYLPNVINLLGLKKGISKVSNATLVMYKHLPSDLKVQVSHNLLLNYQYPQLILSFINFSLVNLNELLQWHLAKRMPWLDLKFFQNPIFIL